MSESVRLAGADRSTTPTLAVGGKPLPPGPLPRGVSAAAFLGGLVAFLVVVVGTLAIYEAGAAFGWADGLRPSGMLADTFDGLTPSRTVFWVSVGLICAGLLTLALAARRRPARAYQVRAQTGVYLRHGDAARLLERDVRLLPGVVDVRVRPLAKKVVVQVVTTGSPDTAEQVRATIDARLGCLVTQPKVRCTVATARHRGEVMA